MKWVDNKHRVRKTVGENSDIVSISQVVKRYHGTIPAYTPTSLHRLNHLSTYLGVGNIFVKDESSRFDLQAFKVLGATYAIGKYIAERLEVDFQKLTFEQLQATKDTLGELTFISATDGNHGRGVAWAAEQLGHRAIIYLPKGASPLRVDHILRTGAKAYVTDVNYDETVEYCANLAKRNNWVFVQDTAWAGYEKIPQWIMEGYQTVALETVDSLGNQRPTHIFLQAGVGSFAASMVQFFLQYDGKEKIKIILVEPHAANCFYQSARQHDGEAQIVTGDLQTIMAGLSCGKPNPVAWNLLKDTVDLFISVPDETAAQGMRILGHPLDNDPRIIAGESGAAPFGTFIEIMRNDTYLPLREQLQLDDKANVLFINTEGNTDPVQYERIVWDGMFSKQ
ncbi:MAG TPA: diaminopropionate ammonia-lyase [Cerasibacillus sp.]|uniref:diaminopropionate ammonia-lyase n=1 Tax=Cerasibacillus sp. TaxID=2498711 RepID=UPI002F42285A